MGMAFESYAQRLLNPFRGAMHTLRYESAEAVTVDGVHWDLYVTNSAALPASGRARHGQISEIRYGSWSPTTGLRRGRLYPSEEFRQMEVLGAILFEQLTRVYQQVPFAFKDQYELWLLDQQAQPLALLESALDANALKFDLTIDWRAGFAARERFQSPSMATLYPQATPTPNAGDYLTGYINARAGKPAVAQWFRRAHDGRGVGLAGIRLPADLEGRTLASAAFPPLLLATTGHDAAHQKLIEDFQAWQAPWLLLLPFDHATRRTLEQQARRQALLVDQQYRLYPASIDANFIPAARVEAVLRRSQQSFEPPPDDTLAPFYIELNQGSDK
jgi:hypothetical protein